MGAELAAEVLANRPYPVPDEWWLLLDLAAGANDRSRRVTYGLDRAKDGEVTTRRWLASLHAAHLIQVVATGDGCAEYEISPIPQRPPRAAKDTEAPVRTALYRIFGDANLLLYIGISKNFGTRWKQHTKVQPWWDEHRRMTVEWRDSRPEAEDAETAAIEAEYPKYNIIHNATATQADAGGMDNLDEVVRWILATPHLPPTEIRIALARATYGAPPGDVAGFVKYATELAGVSCSQAYEAASRRSTRAGNRKTAA